MKKIAIGCFDGVHLGHQALLSGTDVAVTFKAHPLALLCPDRAPRQIMDLADRTEAIRACGVGEVVTLDFTRELAELSPEEFLRRYLPQGGEVTIRCGSDWRFGRGGSGNAETLMRLGIRHEIVPYAIYADERVSSSRIRTALKRGELEAANAMLGRRYGARGTVVRGKGKGTEFGFPTLNLAGAKPMLPDGVYAVKAAGVTAIANWGTAPTMGADAWRERVLEVHLVEAADELPSLGGEVRVEFIRRLRDERKFDSIAALQAQIAKDIAEVKRVGCGHAGRVTLPAGTTQRPGQSVNVGCGHAGRVTLPAGTTQRPGQSVNVGCGHAGRVTLPVRKRLDHRGPLSIDVRNAWYFITICAAGHRPWAGSRVPRDRAGTTVGSRVPRDRLPMDFDSVANAILSAARWYHEHDKWRLSLFLVMPDHLHFIAHFPESVGCGHAGRVTLPMTAVIQQFKAYLNRACGLEFQRDFFETRIRDDAQYAENFQYVCDNPVRKELCENASEWKYVITFDRETGE